MNRIHRAVAFPCAHQRMDFVDEQNNLTVRLGHLVDDGLQPLFKFTFIFRAGNQRTHVQRENLLRFQILRHVAPHNPVRQPFGNRGLTDTRLTNQYRVAPINIGLFFVRRLKI